MEDLETELVRAREELHFWKDFAQWHTLRDEPDLEQRIREATQRAEARYLAVKILVEDRDTQEAPLPHTGTLH